MKTKGYYITRTIVRGIFYTLLMGLALLAFYAFYLAVWSLQF